MAEWIPRCKGLNRKPEVLAIARAPEDIDQIIAEGKAKDAQQLAADGEVKPLAEPDTTNRHNRSVDNINARPTGTSAAYIVRRLKRDAPEVAEALARGEYPSARAAGIAAGIVKVPAPLDLGKRAWAKMSKKERTAFRRWLETPDATE